MSSTPVAPQALPASEPVRLRIPQIDVDADVVDLGLNPDGTLEVPTDFEQTGWYTGRSTPGEAGPLVVAGHVDSFTGPAVFFRLRKLEEGSEVLIDRADGQTVLYRVSSTSEVAKDSFPTDQVYGLTAEPTLRLITCGGTFDHDEGSWVNNLIVYADYLGVQPATAGTTTAG